MEETKRRGLVHGNPELWECRAGLGRPSVMDPSSVTDRRSEFIYIIGQNYNFSGRNFPYFWQLTKVIKKKIC